MVASSLSSGGKGLLWSNSVAEPSENGCALVATRRHTRDARRRNTEIPAKDAFMAGVSRLRLLLEALLRLGVSRMGTPPSGEWQPKEGLAGASQAMTQACKKHPRPLHEGSLEIDGHCAGFVGATTTTTDTRGLGLCSSTLMLSLGDPCCAKRGETKTA